MDQYYIVKILGRGSEGQVLLAEHKKTHEEFAIKRLEWTSFEDANYHLQEANRFLVLEHKNIMKYHSVFLSKYSAETSFVCICVEYCPGGDLFKVIQRSWSHGKFMNEDDILRYTMEIAEGLHYLHSQNIIHRDLKPGNILVSRDGSLKIGDFGISREMGTSLAKTQCGTPNFMSWEMLNKEEYDEMTDMYSLGVIILQCLTGKAYMMSIELNKNPNLFSDLERELARKYHYTPELIQLSKRLVSFTPSERPSAQETIKILKKLISKKRRNDALGIDSLCLYRAHLILTEHLKLKIFSYLDIADMFYVMLVCKNFYNIWDTKWWLQYVSTTTKGEKIMKNAATSVATPTSTSEQLSTSAPLTTAPTVKQKRDQTMLPNGTSLLDTIGVSQVLHMGTHMSKEEQNRSYKEQIFTYFKIHRPQKKRARRNMGKRIVAEIHPSQIEDAAEFLAKTLKTSPSSWGQYVFNLKPVEEDAPRSEIDIALQNATDIFSLQIPNVTDVETNNDSSGHDSSGRSNSHNSIQAPKPIYQNISDAKFAQMKWFFLCMIRYGIKYGRVWVSTFYYNKLFVREIQGISIWLHPYNAKNVTLWKMMRVGFAQAFNHVGISTLTRTMRTLDVAEKIHSTILDQTSKSHWTLFLIAVKPGMHNNGIGASLLHPVLKSADEQSIPIYTALYTPSLDMIRFFKRHGFEIAEKVETPKYGPPFYAMIRYSQ